MKALRKTARARRSTRRGFGVVPDRLLRLVGVAKRQVGVMNTDGFTQLIAQIEDFRWLPGFSIQQIGAPRKIAPFSYALEVDVFASNQPAAESICNGRLILLHDPAGNDAWDGCFRFVSYTRAEVDQDMVTDPLLAEVGWSWLTEALDEQGAGYTAPAGTVTSVSSTSFGAMATEPTHVEIEIRASWTPLFPAAPNPVMGAGPAPDITPHLQAWQHLLCHVAGLPPVPAGIVPLGLRMGMA